MRYFGRKTLAIGFFLLSSASTSSMSINNPTTRVMFALSAKFANAGYWRVIQYIVVETYPTELRNTAYSFGRVFSRIGAITAPFVRDIVSYTQTFRRIENN